MLAPEPIDLAYEADLLGNIQQALAGLQGFDVMAFELIQNADDAAAKVISFDVRDNALVVRNDGRFSTCGLEELRCPWERNGGPDGLARSCNFHAISRVGSRSKIHAVEQIGRFGIGFVSVYQITDAPVIRSTGIEMRLDPLHGEAPTSTVVDAGGTEFELPWASVASATRKALNASPTPNGVAKLLFDAIADVMAAGLFFLRHVRNVELRRNGVLERSVIIQRDNGLLTLEITPKNKVERWKVLTRDASDLAAERDVFTDYPTLAQLDRSTLVQVAIPLAGDSSAGLLYAYLPTEQKSGMPLHINGDFFPHPNRRSIVLSGEQHERYWNELLLDTAARAIGESFTELRDLLGGLRLWTLGNAAFALRETRGFSEFWKIFYEAARVVPSIWTVAEEWHKPAECRLPHEKLSGAEQAALTNVGLKLLHSDLRPMWTVLSSVGVTQLSLSAIVDAIQVSDSRAKVTLKDPHLRPLWAAVDTMLEVSRPGTGFNETLKRLKATTFLLNINGEPASIADVWRLPDGVLAEAVKNYVADCPLVHHEVSRHLALWDAIDIFGFDDLALQLAKAITDASSAATVIGTDGQSVRRFYDLLTSFEVDPQTSRASAILADVPMLRTLNGFVSPSRGRLPGGFVDPIGYFELVDTALVSGRMDQLARTVLGVQVLTFKEYVEDHLEEILAADIDRDQYAALILAIVEHRAELDADGGLEPLAEQAFVRTRAGSYAQPRDCYYWSASFEVLLGDDGDHWVDEGWMPAGRPGGRFRDLLEDRLGMRTTVSTRHIVDRIAEIAEIDTIDGIADKTAPIVRHLLERWSRLSPSDHRNLEKLRGIAFLPAAVSGERVPAKRYKPGDVYRAFRATGFSSQVPIVDLPPLRQGGGALTDLLDLLGMPLEPPTEKVVAHLEHCMAKGLQAPDTIYAILNERLETTDAACIDRLAGTDFIYDVQLERYLPPGKVFWMPPPFGGHWHAASSRMRQREGLYRRLGVVDAPRASNYSDLLGEIAGQALPSSEDAAVHARCLAWLAEELDRGELEAQEALDGLREKFALLNLHGRPVWTDDAAWVDTEWLATPFDDALDEWLVAPPAIHRSAAARLFRYIGVVPLSELARLRLASVPDNRIASEATERLRERADLLLWLAPSQEFRNALRSILLRIEVRLTASLQVQAEITEFEPPVRSQISSVPAFYDSDTAILHIRTTEGESLDWSAAFRALFAQLENYSHSIEMPPIVMTAAFVTSLGTWREAERALRNADYIPPKEDDDELPLGQELNDAPDDAVNDDRLGGTESDSAGPAEQSSPNADAGKNGNYTGPHGEVGDHKITDGQLVDDPASAMRRGDDPFKSRDDDGTFGADLETATVEKRMRGGRGEGDGGSSTRSGRPGAEGGSRRQDTKRERQTRRSRMLAYVTTHEDQSDGTRRVGDDDEISELIDVAAIAAALRYEQKRGWISQNMGVASLKMSENGVIGSGRRLKKSSASFIRGMRTVQFLSHICGLEQFNAKVQVAAQMCRS